MSEGIAVEAVKRIVSQEPRRTAGETLWVLIQHLEIDVGCLFRTEENGPRLPIFVGHNVHQDDIDAAEHAWTDARESMRAGHTYTSEDERFLLVPLNTKGLLYLASREHKLRVEACMVMVTELLPIFTTAIEAGEPPSRIEAFLAASSDDDLERGRILALLRRHKWNVSEVARIMGVHRLTMYKRMRRLGIKREKPPTKGRPRATPGEAT